ncbi:MAG: hypothetical protein L3J54_05175 [Draconibacterium sp.]|nr:hypothetical protein [Draconibacterium sp.]
MDGIKYLTDEKGKRIAIQIDLYKHKKFIYEYIEFIEDRNDIMNSQFEPTVTFEEVLKKFENLHGEKI